ncbi:maleylpyruvate isomerase N-terminal domain-containing protein, partial [Streptomyces sp. NPDC004561]
MQHPFGSATAGAGLGDLIEDVVRSADRLGAAAAGLSDAGLRAPSRQPAWTRGHVLAHVSHSADA